MKKDDLIRENLPAVDMTLNMYDSIDSTNATAKRLIAAGELSGVTALISDEQTAGYGRHGRAFFSPENVGLYLTLVVPVSDFASIAPGRVTTAVAVGAAEGISTALEVEVGIKWVNDLYYKQRKVAGILVEAVPGDTKGGFLLIGIGVNVQPTDYPQDIKSKAGALSEEAVNRPRLAAALLKHIFDSLHAAPDAVIAKYRERSLVIGQELEAAINQQIIRGRAVDITDAGALVIQSGAGLVTLSSGEVTKVIMKDWEIS
jgi:BirA family biotin operon repressor/biotin-[acetyl-CoA-carboxylase] ligase